MFLVALFQAGWVGTERIYYLRFFRNSPQTGSSPGALTRAFIGRYIVLGIVSGFMSIIAIAPLALIAWALHVPDSFAVWGQAFALLIVDAVLTFVSPALAYSTRQTSTALRIGWAILKEGWPTTLWYAVVAPMAIVALTYMRPQEFRYEVSPIWVVASALAGIVNLAVKGATARFYLRQIDTGVDGSAFDDFLSEEQAKLRGPTLLDALRGKSYKDSINEMEKEEPAEAGS